MVHSNYNLLSFIYLQEQLDPETGTLGCKAEYILEEISGHRMIPGTPTHRQKQVYSRGPFLFPKVQSTLTCPLGLIITPLGNGVPNQYRKVYR